MRFLFNYSRRVLRNIFFINSKNELEKFRNESNELYQLILNPGKIISFKMKEE